MALTRRRFITSCMAATTSLAWSARLMASDPYVLRFASPYLSSEAATSPHMHADIKTQVERLSNGRIRVEILDGGQAGAGPDLMAKVSRGYIQGALVSASNLSPIAPALDILNIPFWCAENQAYENLVNSEVWQRLIIDKVHAAGAIHVWFPYVVGGRTLTTGKHWLEPVMTPEQLANIMVRVPSSELLRHFYTLAGGRARRIDWGKVAAALRAREVDVIDPAINSLYSGPDGLRHQIGHIFQLNSVHDGWMAVINQRWLDSLPKDLQQVMAEAGAQIHAWQPTAARQAQQTASQRFREMGVGIYTPDAELALNWRQRFGHQHPSWRRYKRNILGDELLFNELLRAAEG